MMQKECDYLLYASSTIADEFASLKITDKSLDHCALFLTGTEYTQCGDGTVPPGGLENLPFPTTFCRIDADDASCKTCFQYDKLSNS